MEENYVTVQSVRKVTHDVLGIRTSRPEGYTFIPGQATEISIDKPGWESESRPFTFTCLPDDPYLEFTIKTYPVRKGVTNELLLLKQGDRLIVHDVFGAINYKGEGVFIAGGAGVTPFIAIFRDLRRKNALGGNKLIFANKTRADIILEDEFRRMLGDSFINILSDEKADGYHHGFINEDFLKNVAGASGSQYYVCGPPPMMDTVLLMLSSQGIMEKAITVEI